MTGSTSTACNGAEFDETVGEDCVESVETRAVREL
eukprot:CAMPEP_0169121272 /NCGR_PEP_ID=MMETSP1015-20121227/32578_1 /TAXON_ID=342587 /ORGANISM="Karlodinium micrum, Strain CCMP2283" /LENGTH=34 /DNA_ID= /DNA_START= /DNA_END= /DNA_ORIENTATION=